MNASGINAARVAANFFPGFSFRRFFLLSFCSLTALSVNAINLVVDSWGNLSAAQRTVTQAALDDWEALLPNVAHNVHLTFNFVDFSASSALGIHQPDAEWSAATVINQATGDAENIAIGVSFNFTQDGNLRPISSDIEMNSNASITWHLGLGAPPGGQIDWYSVMSHELCHAIGFTVNYTRFARNVTAGPDTYRSYNSGGTPTATLVSAASGTHLSSTFHPGFLMVPSIGTGERREPSTLEEDLLEHDIWDYPLPDLTYGSQTLSVSGTTADISVRARNISATTGCGASHVGYYLSLNTVISVSDYKIGSDYVAPLAANSYSTETISVNVRSINPPIPPGTYYVGFRIDDESEVEESIESNNSYAFPTPQVTITQMSAPTGVSASDGTYSDRIRVTWNTVAGATHYKLYRATTSSSAAAIAITGWQVAASYDNFVPGGDLYYYWVKAAASSGGSGESGFSASNSGYVLPVALTSDSAQTVTTDPTFYYTDMSAYDTQWWVVGIRYETAGENWSLRLYSDPSCNTELVASTFEDRVDFVVVDGNHVAATDRGVQCYRFRGSNSATVEFEGFSETLSLGSNAATWPAGDVVEMWSVALTPGTYRFDLTFTSGSSDLGCALYNSGDGDYYRTSHEYAGKSDNLGGGVNESFIYTVASSDSYGFCVWANDALAAGFNITITPLAAGLWEGDISADWHTPGNWNDLHVPSAAVDVVIPAGTPYTPVITSAAAHCRDLTIESGATLTMTDDTLTINGDLICYGYFNMSQTSSHAYITNDARWENGSTCTMIGSARIHLGGDWEFKAGSAVVLNSGYVEFTGSATSWIRSYESACKMYHVVCDKTAPGYVGVSAVCVDDLRIHNLYLWQGIFHSYSFHAVIIEGFLNNVYSTGHFQWHYGSLVLAGTGASSTAFKPNTGDYLENLVIDSDAVIECGTNYVNTLVVNGDLTIAGGGLRSKAMTIEVGGSWSNGVGIAGFDPGSDTVRFFGSTPAMILTDETFYYLYVNKSAPASDALQLAAGKVLTVQNDLYLNDGTLKMNAGSTIDINDDLYIQAGAGLNANDNDTSVYLADEWYNYNPAFSATAGFDPGNDSTVTFDGANNQYMYAEDPAVAEVFANLVINKSGGSFMPDEPLYLRGDCTIADGGWSRFAASTGMVHRFTGDLIVEADGSWLDSSAGSTVRFEGRATQTVAYRGSIGSFNEMVVAKTVGTELHLDSDLTVNGPSLYVDSGVLQLNSQMLDCAGGVTVDSDGELRVNQGATLAVGSGSTLGISGGGRLTASGGRSNALITRNGSGNYSFRVQTGATIGAENCTFEFMDGNGVYVLSTGFIDPTLPFTGCTFRSGPAGGTLLQVSNSEKYTILNAVFPDFLAGAYNVAKTLDQGNLKFVHATGDFAGEKYDYDPFDRIDWASGAITSLTILGPTHCTLGGEYRFRTVAAGDSVLTPVTYSYELTDLPNVVHSHSALQDLLDAVWTIPGSKLLRVTASNTAGSRLATRTVEVNPLTIQSILPCAGGCNLTLSGTSADSLYYLEFCTNLLDNSWTPLDDISGTNGITGITSLFEASGVPTNAPALFFRAILKPGGEM